MEIHSRIGEQCPLSSVEKICGESCPLMVFDKEGNGFCAFAVRAIAADRQCEILEQVGESIEAIADNSY